MSRLTSLLLIPRVSPTLGVQAHVLRDAVTALESCTAKYLGALGGGELALRFELEAGEVRWGLEGA